MEREGADTTTLTSSKFTSFTFEELFVRAPDSYSFLKHLPFYHQSPTVRHGRD
jgi:hypothetical protein